MYYYESGEIVQIGDEVRITENNLTGKVVCCIDTNQYSVEFPENQWSYLNRGILIKTNEIGLYHIDEKSVSLQLLAPGS